MMNDAHEIGEVAMAAIEELEELMPEETAVKGVMVIVEMEYECPNCGEPHEFYFTHSNLGSSAYEKGLLTEARGALDQRDRMSSEIDPDHDDD